MREGDYCCREIILLFSSFTILVLILSLRKLRGFLLYGFPEENTVFIVSCVLIAVLFILSVKDPNNATLMLKN